MLLKRYKFLTNRFITRKRIKERHRFEKKSLTESKVPLRYKLSAKSKYITQLPLKVLEPNYSDSDREFAFDFSKLKCNSSWPICVFDHTLKIRKAVYFQYRIKSTNDWIDNYFNNPISKPSKEQEIMIERDRHYCGNMAFVNKIISILLARNECEDAFPSVLLERTNDDPLRYSLMMKTFMDFILFYTLPKESKEEQLIKINVQMKPKTMIGHDLAKVIEENKEKTQRNSISIDNPVMLEEMSKRYKPLKEFIEKIAEKTRLLSRNIDMDASAGGRFLMSILES
jgi:hypothetical protein